MAIQSICAGITKGQDYTCSAPVSRFYQQMVIINFSDFDTKTIEAITTEASCKRNVSFTLKSGKKGFRFSLPENSSAISGTYDKSVDDYGFARFLHRVNFAVADATEEDKCNIEGLSKGRYVAVLQKGDMIEVYGVQNGLTAGDFTADTQANGGFIALTLESLETSLENHVPLVYKATIDGQEIEDFDSDFAAA